MQGVADGTIYLYFKNKDDLLISLFEEKMAEVVAEVRERVGAGDDALSRLRIFIENHMNLLLGGKALFPCREVALQYTRPLGVFHFNAFGELIRNGKVPYLVTHRKKPPVKIADESLSAYVPDTIFGPFRIYRWDPAAADSIAARPSEENIPAN